MSLDLFSSSIEAADQAVAASAARDLPAGFGETFDVAFRAGTEFQNSVGSFIARNNALTDYSDYVFQKTGERLPSSVTEGGGFDLDGYNAAQAKIAEKFPDLGLQPLTAADIDTMMRRRMAKAHDDAAAMAGRETTWGGTAGTALGMLAGGLTDPVTVATLPLGGVGEMGIAMRALEFAAISGGTEAAIAAASYSTREAAVPGSSKDIPGEIAGATLFGGILGAGFGALGKLFRAGERPLPTAAREDINALASEAQINATNPFPTVAGSAAARDGLNEAVNSAIRGEPVRAGDNFDPVYVSEYAAAAKAASPEELAAAGERHLRPETYGEVPDVERFDPMPREADDAASYWESRLEAATPEERAAMGATDADIPARLAAGETIEGPAIKIGDNIYRGQTHSDALDRAARGVKMSPDDFLQQIEGKDSVGLDGFVTSEGRFLTRREAYAAQDALERVSAPDLAPSAIAKLEAEPSTSDAIVHNLEHIMQANPDAEFTFATKLPDGSTRFDTMKLSDVMKDLDETERAAKEIEACAIGMEAAE